MSKMMECETVIKFSAIQSLFNRFSRKGHRFFGDLLDTWISQPDARIRLFGVSRIAYLAMNKNTGYAHMPQTPAALCGR
jgi:hypothetical protein